MDYYHLQWQCPFFKWDEKQRIGCEGGILRFPSKGTCRAFAGKHCASADGWKHCTLANSMNEFYEEVPDCGK